MRVHRPARRQRASTRTWPPGAVAWSELPIWRCSLVFRLVIAAMTLHHHTGDVVSTDSSPKDAFLLSRLTIRAWTVGSTSRGCSVAAPSFPSIGPAANAPDNAKTRGILEEYYRVSRELHRGYPPCTRDTRQPGARGVRHPASQPGRPRYTFRGTPDRERTQKGVSTTPAWRLVCVTAI